MRFGSSNHLRRGRGCRSRDRIDLTVAGRGIAMRSIAGARSLRSCKHFARKIREIHEDAR
jgi:hypothetical protein